MELELEVITALREEKEKSAEQTKAQLNFDSESKEEWNTYAVDDDNNIEDCVEDYWMEMDLLYKQEEMEQAELEAAITLSIAVEEER